MSRLLHFSLNVLIIRRYIVDDIRGPKVLSLDEKRAAIPEQPATKLSYKGFVSEHPTLELVLWAHLQRLVLQLKQSRPKSGHFTEEEVTQERILKQLLQTMPTLDASRLVPIVENIPVQRSISTASGNSCYFR